LVKRIGKKKNNVEYIVLMYMCVCVSEQKLEMMERMEERELKKVSNKMESTRAP
jgi:hypothetical protein